jgi:hypothetical protein
MAIWEILLFDVGAIILLILILACLVKIKTNHASVASYESVSKFNGDVSDLIKDIHAIKDIDIVAERKYIAHRNGNVFDIIRELHLNAKS